MTNKKKNKENIFVYSLFQLLIYFSQNIPYLWDILHKCPGRCGHDRDGMLVRFTTTYAISVYHH